VIERYRAHLFSYAAFRGCPYGDDHREKCFLMIGIERCIYEAIERGIEQEYGMDMAAMLSILHEEITSDDILETLEKKHPSNCESRQPYMRPASEERFSQVLTWILTTVYTQASTLPPNDELNKILHELYEHWDTMPIIQPLVS